MIQVIMPRLSAAMKSGTIVKWLKKEGDSVEEGDTLAEIETEKIIDEIKSPASGVLHRILSPEGSSVPVGQLIALITEPRGVAAFEETEKTASLTAEKSLRVSPLARKIALEHGIDLTKISGTGPEGEITKDDVLKALRETEGITSLPKVLSSTGLQVTQTLPLTGIRKTIAERLYHSYHEAPHVTLTMEVDMSEAKRFREKLMSEAKEGAKFTVTYTDIIVKAVAMALKKNPVINSSLEGDSIKIFKDVNVGIAVAVEDGLIVPVIHNADQMSIEEIASRRKHLVEKAARRELSVDEVSGGTFTVSNLGMFDVDAFSPIINPPQSAILGVGAIKNKALVVDGQVVARPAMTLSLVFDHRVFDGAQAAAFLKDIKETLEKPFAYMNIG